MFEIRQKGSPRGAPLVQINDTFVPVGRPCLELPHYVLPRWDDSGAKQPLEIARDNRRDLVALPGIEPGFED